MSETTFALLHCQLMFEKAATKIIFSIFLPRTVPSLPYQGSQPCCLPLSDNPFLSLLDRQAVTGPLSVPPLQHQAPPLCPLRHKGPGAPNEGLRLRSTKRSRGYSHDWGAPTSTGAAVKQNCHLLLGLCSLPPSIFLAPLLSPAASCRNT